MKLIFPLIILLSISKIGKSQDSNILVFYSILKEKKFQNLIGEKYIIPKKCNPAYVGDWKGDEVFYEHARIGRIKSCKIRCTVKNDTIQSMIIYLGGHRQFHWAKKQAQREFGKANHSQYNDWEIFKWKGLKNEFPIDIIFSRKKHEWATEMRIGPPDRS